MTVELIQDVLLAFAVVVILMPGYIRFLRYIGMGKRIREEGPETHQAKAGTPTMGGLLVIAVVLALFFLIRGFPPGGIFAPLAALLLVVVFTLSVHRRVAMAGDADQNPGRCRLVALVSLSLWTTVAVGGRWIGFP